MGEVFQLILTSSLYASIVGIFIILLKSILKNKINPKWHYIIWGILVVKMLIPFGPQSMVSMFNAMPQVPQSISFTEDYRVSENMITPESRDSSPAPAAQTVAKAQLSTKVYTLIPFIWIAGALSMLLWLLFTRYLIGKRLKNKGSVPNQAVAEVFTECREKIGVGKNIEIVVQDVINTPSIFGILKPKILITPSICSLSRNEISYILLHELAHYKRKDILANYILLVLQILHWFNPIIWFCFKKIRQDMELAADEKVLALLKGEEQKDYGKALLSVLESYRLGPYAPSLIGMVDDRKNIERRIRNIKIAQLLRGRRRLAISLSLISIMVLCGLFLTSALPKKTTFEIKNSSIEVPNDLKVMGLGEYLRFEKSGSYVGGVQMLDYEISRNLSFPNSIAKSKRNVDGLVTKAVLVNLDSQINKTQKTKNENHLFLIFDNEKAVYDIYADTKYVSEASLLAMGKSFKAPKHNKLSTFYSSEGWTINYPSSWRTGGTYIDEPATGKTLEFFTAACSKNELETWLNKEIERKLAATEASNTISEPLSSKKDGSLLCYTYSIKSKMESTETILKTTVFFDGSKRYEFRSSLPPMTNEEYESIVKSFKIVKANSLDDNKEIMKKYISEFLKNGYSKYYVINNINFEFVDQKISNGKLEAKIITTMNYNVPFKDPDTVPYIIEAKQKAEKETNSARKKMLSDQYQSLKSSYRKPSDLNYWFKLTANVSDKVIDEKSIKLYLEQDISAGKTEYIPAEEILPK